MKQASLEMLFSFEIVNSSIPPKSHFVAESDILISDLAALPIDDSLVAPFT